mgnify:CR=1 FL=1
MNMLFKAASAALLLGATAAPAVAQQLTPAVIVIVDMDRVVNESAAGKQAGTELQAGLDAAIRRARPDPRDAALAAVRGAAGPDDGDGSDSRSQNEFQRDDVEFPAREISNLALNKVQ